jgi:hypothetical protein
LNKNYVRKAIAAEVQEMRQKQIDGQHCEQMMEDDRLRLVRQEKNLYESQKKILRDE